MALNQSNNHYDKFTTLHKTFLPLQKNDFIIDSKATD